MAVRTAERRCQISGHFTKVKTKGREQVVDSRLIITRTPLPTEKVSSVFYAAHTNGFPCVCKSPTAYYACMQMPHLHCNYRTICRAHRDNKDTKGDHLGEIAFPPRAASKLRPRDRAPSKFQLNAKASVSFAPLFVRRFRRVFETQPNIGFVEWNMISATCISVMTTGRKTGKKVCERRTENVISVEKNCLAFERSRTNTAENVARFKWKTQSLEQTSRGNASLQVVTGV